MSGTDRLKNWLKPKKASAGPGRQIANGQTDGHPGDNIIRPLRAYNKSYYHPNLM